MKRIVFLLLLPVVVFAHPGIGIVKDSKGNIYYTDLHRVWKISRGVKSVAVPNVHTHELFVDKIDNLYGEGGYYDEKTGKFYHFLWVYRANGKIDTVVGMKEAYVQHDFSLARDREGNEYYTKSFLKNPDTNHIYRKSTAGNETVFARGHFKGVSWIHVQDDGTVLYVSNNAIYSVDRNGKVSKVKDGIASEQPSFKFSGNNKTVWGVWKDDTGNIYAAVFSDQAIKKIDKNGRLSTVYQSTGKWTPLHGVFDNQNRLWVLEGSDKNEVRVTLAGKSLSST